MSGRPVAALGHVRGLDLFPPSDLDRLGEVVTLVDPEPFERWDDPRARALLPAVEVVIGHWGCPRIDAAALDALPRLGLFAYAAGTVKQTVTPEVFARGVRVTSGARANAEPVAEFTLAAILFANKGVMWRRLVAPGHRPSGPTPPADGIPPGNRDKTIGIVGASLVGRRVIELLAAFPDLAVTLYDPFVTAAEAAALGVTVLDLDELCAGADVLSIHAPDLPTTRGMIGAAQLALLRDGVTVINTARPALVDQPALVAEVAAGRLWAVLDVTDPEPLPGDHALRRLPGAFVTPHLAGSEGTELGRMTAHVVEEVRRWRAGEPGLNQVHADQLDRLA